MSVMPEGLEQMPDNDFRNLIWFILHPPQENKETKTETKKLSQIIPMDGDGESVALWNPDWQLRSESATKLPEYAGRHNVLVTQGRSTLRHEMRVEAGKKTRLSVTVAAPDDIIWTLQIFANGESLSKTTIDHSDWRRIDVDLSRFAGNDVTVELQSATGAAIWSGIVLEVKSVTKLAATN
jgi:hypothetical protein